MGLRFFSLLLLSLGLMSCATFSSMSSNEVIREIDAPLGEVIRTVEASLPLGKRLSQDQGRVSFSNYFMIVEGKGLVSAEGLPERYFAEVAVVGDRRPYLVDIRVIREVRRPQRSGVGQDSYQRQGYSRELAQLVRQRIQLNLSQRRDGYNIIDDFRAF